jgi:glycosyltransferase involved in cell wall biosynthesis
MMRVLANLSFVLPGEVGGSEEHSVRLLRSVIEHAADEIDLGIVAHDRLFDAHPALVPCSAARIPGPVHRRAYRVAAESVLLPRQTSAAALTHHFGGRLPARHTRPAVVTVHDIQPLDLAQNFSAAKRAFLARSLPRTTEKCDLILTPTQWVADRISERLGVHPERLRVVGPALGRRPVPSERDAYDFGDRPVVLFPSVTHPHKNHATLIDAMVQVRRAVPDVVLVLTGGAGLAADDVAARIAEADPDGSFIRHLGRIEERELMGLLADADLVAFPSRYEGFGLPVLEAMHGGTPVVAADSTCLPEVVGEAGVLVDVDDVEAWASTIVDLLGRPERRAEMAAAGAVRAERWAPPVAAATLVEAWRDAAR